jgi:hypothetical protein
MARRCLSVRVVAWVCVPLVAACGGARSQAPPTVGRAGAVRSDHIDLRSPDVDGRMDPVSNGRVFACSGARRIEVSFDPGGTAAVVAGSEPLVYGAVTTRAVNRACRSIGPLHAVPTGALRERARAVKLTCLLPRSARFAVDPIVVAGRERGSTVLVLDRRLRRVLLLVVLEPREARIFYASACRTR